jgi:hypothetical protein
MNTVTERAVRAELQFRNALIRAHDSFFAKLKDARGDVPGWVLVVLMTTGLVTAIWTIAAPRLTVFVKHHDRQTCQASKGEVSSVFKKRRWQC